MEINNLPTGPCFEMKTCMSQLETLGFDRFFPGGLFLKCSFVSLVSVYKSFLRNMKNLRFVTQHILYCTIPRVLPIEIGLEKNEALSEP